MRLAFGDLTDQRAARPRFGRRMQFPESSQRFDGRHERLFLRGPVELVQLQPAPGRAFLGRSRIGQEAPGLPGRDPPRSPARKTTVRRPKSSPASWRCRSRSPAVRERRTRRLSSRTQGTRRRLHVGVKYQQPRRSAGRESGRGERNRGTQRGPKPLDHRPVALRTPGPGHPRLPGTATKEIRQPAAETALMTRSRPLR